MPDIPVHMKNDNWDFFVEAKSGDPTHKIPGCENLVENLLTSTKLVGATEYDKTLDRCKVWANRAHYHYYVENDVYEAIKYCNAIMQDLTPIIYEPQGRFASIKSGAFRFVAEVKNV